MLQMYGKLKVIDSGFYTSRLRILSTDSQECIDNANNMNN